MALENEEYLINEAPKEEFMAAMRTEWEKNRTAHLNEFLNHLYRDGINLTNQALSIPPDPEALQASIDRFVKEQ